MLQELSVRNLGVIADLALVFRPGMTVLTGETGAGKTLVVEAISLLLGGRGDTILVRPGADEAWVEARFDNADGDDELILGRAVPAGGGRSRAYANGRMATIGQLSQVGSTLVDLHGQHTHQSLLAAAVQRAALDAFAGIDLSPLEAARRRRRELDASLSALGGDTRARAREIDLLRFQLSEIESAGLGAVDEDEQLAAEEDRLADATAHREAAIAAYGLLSGESAAIDAVGAAISSVADRGPLSGLETRLRSLAAELTDVAAEARALTESIIDDPDRLEAVRRRRNLLHDLCRKYGASITEVMGFAVESRRRLDELESYDTKAAELEAAIATTSTEIRRYEADVGAGRRRAAPALARAVEGHLRSLAMPKARFEVHVEDADPGDGVAFLLGANPGEPLLPLARVASGGELARTMLAARLVLTTGPPTLVFDEVDAGIGGEAALVVGRALAALGRESQVLVVTHLPQVAAFADNQIVIEKAEHGGRTIASARAVEGGERIVELSRMLSGRPGSAAAQGHAEELLQVAAEERARGRS